MSANDIAEPIGAVVVTYFPEAGFADRLAAIAREVGSTVVVDNSAEPETRDEIRAICARVSAEFLAHSENLGLAAALNWGFQIHAERGINWVIAFDQDSVPEAGFSRALHHTATRTISTAPAAVVGANWRDEARPDVLSRHLRRNRYLPFLFERLAADSDLDDITCVITSGSLFHVPTWRALGGFDEALFLDLVDTDYCLRATRAGYGIRVATAARLRHRRGAKQPVRFLGRTFWPAFMPPLRLRYLFRNRMRLVARHALHAPHWVAFELVYALKVVGEIVLLERDKFVKLKACIHGAWDGLLGRRGKIT